MKKLSFLVCFLGISVLTCADNSIILGNRSLSASQLSTEIYKTIFYKRKDRDNDLFVLAAVKCYESLDKKGEEISDDIKADLKKILDLYVTHRFGFDAEEKKLKAQAFCLMYCGYMPHIENGTAKDKYRI